MRKPYGGILFASMLLAALYVMYEGKPDYVKPMDEIYDRLLFGIELTIVIFCVFSIIYLAGRKRR